VGVAGLLAFPFYYYMTDLAERLKIKRSNENLIKLNLPTENTLWRTVCIHV
jgi:hypothetical protein